MYGYIYKIENIVNGKIYIGQTTTTPKIREHSHVYELRNNNHKNSHLQNSFNFHGESNFKFSVISWFNSKEELNQAEIHYINIYDSLNKDKGYNIREGGHNGKHSKETKIKLSIAHRGKNLPESTCKKISIALQGKTLTAEHRRKMSIAQKGNENKLGKGLFRFPGTSLNKRRNPERKCWESRITCKGKTKSLGMYQDPLSASIVYDLVKSEIF
jgi:group I intron endonuclease